MLNQVGKKGFTMIEILIVLGIIAALSALAVSGYSQYRRSALIDLSVDSFVSQVGELRSRTVYGEVGDAKYDEIVSRLEGEEVDAVLDDGLRCYGFHFEEDKVQGFSLDFIGKRRWDEGMRQWVFSGCDEFKNREEMRFVMEDDVVIDVAEGFVGRFVPPEGNFEVSMDGGLSFETLGGEFDFTMRLGEELERDVLIDLRTGRIK